MDYAYDKILALEREMLAYFDGKEDAILALDIEIEGVGAVTSKVPAAPPPCMATT